jgi:hypothetical protein
VSAEFDKLLPLLVRGCVEFILIGGVAGNILGSARVFTSGAKQISKELRNP